MQEACSRPFTTTAATTMLAINRYQSPACKRSDLDLCSRLQIRRPRISASVWCWDAFSMIPLYLWMEVFNSIWCLAENISRLFGIIVGTKGNTAATKIKNEAHTEWRQVESERVRLWYSHNERDRLLAVGSSEVHCIPSLFCYRNRSRCNVNFLKENRQSCCNLFFTGIFQGSTKTAVQSCTEIVIFMLDNKKEGNCACKETTNGHWFFG